MPSMDIAFKVIYVRFVYITAPCRLLEKKFVDSNLSVALISAKRAVSN